MGVLDRRDLPGCYKLADFGTAVLLEEVLNLLRNRRRDPFVARLTVLKAARRRDETGTLWCAWGWAVWQFSLEELDLARARASWKKHTSL